jgi:hypothetical protein
LFKGAYDRPKDEAPLIAADPLSATREDLPPGRDPSTLAQMLTDPQNPHGA